MTIDRRKFLKNGLLAASGVAALGGAVGSAFGAALQGGKSGQLGSTSERLAARNASGTLAGYGARAATAVPGARSVRNATSAAEKVVVVVNLYGGNDGLNTVVPTGSTEYDEYLALRKTIFWDKSQLLPLSGEPDFMLNPGMTAFQGLFNQGRLAIINGVSVPGTAVDLFSHEAGQYEFQSCDLVRNVTTGAPTGWIGRYLDSITPGQVSPGIDMGGGRLMLTGASRVPVSINSVKQFQLQVTDFDRTARRNAYDAMMAVANPAGGVAETNRQYRLSALLQSDVIQAATATYLPTVTYPDSYLGFQLSEAAKIIYGNVGARAIAVGVNGFDTHSGQNDLDNGVAYHAALLGGVSDSIAAFYADLQNLGLSDRVMILTISEFGRRAYENGDQGTDHGFASVAFALGDDVNGGIYGLYPSLTNLVLDGNLDQTTDFRSVYASTLANYLGADPVPILGGSFPTIPFV